MKTILVLLFISIFLFNPEFTEAQNHSVFHNNTVWEFESSIKYDALCLLNSLTGDPYYVKFYKNDYEEFKSKFTPEVKVALENLKQIKESTGIILSAGLSLYYSACPDSTLQQLINTTQDLTILKSNFSQTVYYKDNEWALFESIQKDMRAYFTFLKEAGFEEFWRENILPKVEKRIYELDENITNNNLNMITEQEKLLGYPLQNNRITVIVLYYAQPHGIKITGTKFITDVAYPIDVVVQNAAHEMLHPPYDLNSNIPLKNALDKLKNDTFLMDKVLNHNPVYGYNNFEAYLEENCVRALDQLVSENLGLSLGPKDRWLKSDEGMHVFANALYSEMKEENYNQKNEIFSDFLIRIINDGRFESGTIKKRFDSIEP